MSRRASGERRVERDAYETPEWVSRLVLPHVPDYVTAVWEPACGSGKMVDVLTEEHVVYATDITTGVDFLKATSRPESTTLTIPQNAIITNPPFAVADRFARKALSFMIPVGGFVALLLPIDFDSAYKRTDLFRDCPFWHKKLVLTERIVWMVTEGKDPRPSENHAWYMWCCRSGLGPPTIEYAVSSEEERRARRASLRGNELHTYGRTDRDRGEVPDRTTRQGGRVRRSR